MKRRKFLKYTSLTTASLAVAACGKNGVKQSENKEPLADFGKLEKSSLTLGIVPRLEAAPLIIAKEQGFFSRYGLEVNLSRQLNWEGVQDNLINGAFDASQALFGMPLMAQLAKRKVPMVALMVLNRNGSAITLAKKAWDANLRTSKEYTNFEEFGSAYRDYLSTFEEPTKFGIESPASMDNLLTRYWLGAIGINPDQDLELTEFAPSEMIYKLQAGLIEGYCLGTPWNQQAIETKAGFTAYTNRDIWQGYPGQVLATMASWVEKHPNTARALVAALLEACQFCDQLENSQLIAQTLAQDQYINKVKVNAIELPLKGLYQYGGFDGQSRIAKVADFNLFHYQKTNYLTKPDHANYPWHSYGVWLLTQMVRWSLINSSEYPVDADEIIEEVYPLQVYQDVAQAIEIKLPVDSFKVEPAQVFIDQREFDPSQPLAYLNSFLIRANRPVIFI